MKKKTTVIFLCFLVYSLSSPAQSPQPQNSNQNTTPVHNGGDRTNSNPSPQTEYPSGNPGNNTAPGTKPVNGVYGNTIPAGGTGPSGIYTTPPVNNGAGRQKQPQRYNGSEHQRSPQ